MNGDSPLWYYFFAGLVVWSAIWGILPGDFPDDAQPAVALVVVLVWPIILIVMVVKVLWMLWEWITGGAE